MHHGHEKNPRADQGGTFCAQDGFTVLGATIFAGLIMLVVAFSLLAQYGLLAQIGQSGMGLTVILVIVGMVGVYKGARFIKSLRFRTGIKDPMFMRAFMQSCYAGDCGRIEKALADTEGTPLLILNDLLAEKMQRILQTDALNLVDVQEMYTKSGLKKTSEPEMDRFFHTPEAYEKELLPEEIEHIIQAVTTKYPELMTALDSMLAARAHLFTLMGDYLDIMPPSAHYFKFIKKTYRYRPPDDETTRRIAFALDTLSLLRAYNNQELRGERLIRHGRLAAERIPQLAAAVSHYKTTFETLVEAYESMPMGQAPKAKKFSS
jgi:hypothetical protein